MQRQPLIGKMDKKIRVYRLVKSKEVGPLGEDLEKPKLIGYFWASIESRTGSLLKGRTADTILTQTTHVIRLRYTNKITHDCWIEYAGHHFDIDYVSDPTFSSKWLEVYVSETRI